MSLQSLRHLAVGNPGVLELLAVGLVAESLVERDDGDLRVEVDALVALFAGVVLDGGHDAGTPPLAAAGVADGDALDLRGPWPVPLAVVVLAEACGPDHGVAVAGEEVRGLVVTPVEFAVLGDALPLDEHIASDRDGGVGSVLVGDQFDAWVAHGVTQDGGGQNPLAPAWSVVSGTPFARPLPATRMTADRARLLVALDGLDVQGLASIDLADVPEVEVTDPVYALALDAAVDTNMATLELGIEATTYQPDAFPGVVYQGDPATVFVFGTGQLVVADADSRADAEVAVATVAARLVETDLVDPDAVPEAGAEAVALPPAEDLPEGVREAAEPAAEPECPDCGNGLDGTENFCPSCGADLA